MQHPDTSAASSKEPPVTLNPKLLALLVCPLTKGPLVYKEEAQELISKQANLAYPVRQGVPILLVDEARSLDADLAGNT